MGLLASLVAVAATSLGKADDRAPARASVRPDGVSAARELIGAVRRGDVDGVMRFIEKSGVPCVDSKVEYEEVKRQLKDEEEFLHASFFDGRKFRERFANPSWPVSISEMLQAPNELTFQVEPSRDGLFPCVTLRAGKAVAGLCLMWRNGRWVLATLPGCE
jgi:hypothetical protein